MQQARSVPVLMYHHVSPSPGLVTVSPQNFESQMQALVNNGYTTLTTTEFMRFLQGNNDIPQRSILITFDDGYLDNYVYAFPVMQRLGLHGVIFTVTSWIGEGSPRRHAGQSIDGNLPDCPNHKQCGQAIANARADEVMLRWAELKHMETSGVFEIHSHTHTHVRWDKLYSDKQEQLEKLKQDLAISQQILKDKLEKSDIHLCWPWGYFEPEYQTIASQLGFGAQYTIAKGLNRPGDPPTHVRRLVAKDRGGDWLANRLWIYRQPLLGSLYLSLRGE